MINFDFELLRGVGLSETLAQRARDAADAERDDSGIALALMRVTAVHRATVQLHDGRAMCAARVLPRLQRGDLGADAIAVGDWVLVGADDAADPWVRARVEPTSRIARRDGDGSRHAIVSNVDHALIVMGLDDDFNLRRLERYLSLVLASGVAPVVVLSKADIAAADPVRRDAQVAQLRERLPAAEVVIVDATDGASAASIHAPRGLGPHAGPPRLVGSGQVDPDQHLARGHGPGHRRGPRQRRARHTRRRRARCIACRAAPASSTRRACAPCVPTPMPTRSSPASPTWRRFRHAAASATARTAASRAAPFAPASIRTGSTTSRRCCAKTVVTA